jgi:hypothetical protein
LGELGLILMRRWSWIPAGVEDLSFATVREAVEDDDKVFFLEGSI